jgi:hypothetical protein
MDYYEPRHSPSGSKTSALLRSLVLSIPVSAAGGFASMLFLSGQPGSGYGVFWIGLVIGIVLIPVTFLIFAVIFWPTTKTANTSESKSIK